MDGDIVMSVSFTLLCRFKAIPVKIATGCFFVINKLNLNLFGKQRSLNSQSYCHSCCWRPLSVYLPLCCISQWLVPLLSRLGVGCPTVMSSGAPIPAQLPCLSLRRTAGRGAWQGRWDCQGSTAPDVSGVFA